MNTIVSPLGTARISSDNSDSIAELVAEGCPKRTPTLAGPRGTLFRPSVEVGIDLSAGQAKVPARTFLGTEVNGSFQPTLGLITPRRDADGTGINGFIKLDTTNVFNLPFGQNPPKTSFVRFGINRSEFDLKQGFGNIDPGANTDLLIPGPLGGPSGFSIGPNAVVTGGQYGLDYSQTGFTGDLGIESDYPYWAYPTHLTGYVRVGVYDISIDERFSGIISGFNREFGYGTHIDATRTTYGVGIEGRSQIARFSSPTIAGFTVQDSTADFWDVALRYAGEFGGFRMSADGTDSLSFTGFPTSTAQLDASESGTYYKLGIGLEVKGGPMKSYVMFNYENMGGFPLVTRDGTNPSQLQFDGGDSWSVNFGTRIGF